jgi:uncharacterized membrane protein
MMLVVFRPTASFRRTWWSLFALLLIGCLAWATATPLMASADEGAHAVRAAGVARGQLLPERKRLIVESWVQHVPEVYAANGSGGCFEKTRFLKLRRDALLTPACVPDFRGSDRLVAVPTYEFRGSPGYYWIVGLPTLVWPDRPGIIGMRIINALAWAALLASAFASSLHRRGRSWAVAGVALAVTPMVWYLGGTINPNGTEIAAAITLWATLLALAGNDSDESDGRLIARAGVAGLILVSMRGLGPGFAMIAVVATALVATRERLRAVLARRDTRIWSGVVLLGVAVTIVWTGVVGLKLDQPEHPPVGFVDAFHTLPVILRQSVGAMGTNFLPLPYLLLAAWVVLAVVAIVVGFVDARHRGRIAIAIVALATVALPITTDGYNVPNIGFPWQGRYGLPLTVGLVILACWLVDATATRRRAVGAGIICVAFAGQVGAFVAIGRRLGMGRVQGADVLDFVIRPHWEPPFPPALLLAGMIVAATGVAALAIRATLRDVEPPMPDSDLR